MHSQVIEYASDLREFWKRGSGHDINSKASCGLFHDVFNRLNSAARENRQVNIKFIRARRNHAKQSSWHSLQNEWNNLQYNQFYRQRLSLRVFCILTLLSNLFRLFTSSIQVTKHMINDQLQLIWTNPCFNCGIRSGFKDLSCVKVWQGSYWSSDGPDRPRWHHPATSHPPRLLQGQLNADRHQLRWADASVLPHQPHDAVCS